MEFKNKLKTRLYLAIAYIVIGLAMIVVFNIMENSNEFLSTLGLVLVVTGVVRWRNYRRITKTEETMKAQEIKETDERNVAIVQKARNIAFVIFVMVLALAIIVLQFLNLALYVQLLFAVMCVLLAIYWVSYLIIRKIS